MYPTNVTLLMLIHCEVCAMLAVPRCHRLDVTAVSNNSVCTSLCQSCEDVRFTQRNFETSNVFSFRFWDSININCILSLSINVAVASVVSICCLREISTCVPILGCTQLHFTIDVLCLLAQLMASKISCPKPAPMNTRTVWSHSASRCRSFL